LIKSDTVQTLVSSLANGTDPLTGEEFPSDSPYQNPKIIRALFKVLNSLSQPSITQPHPHMNTEVSIVKNFDYAKVFELTEKTLIQYGAKYKDKKEVIQNLSEFKKFETTKLTDEDYYEKIVFVIFYSGFRAATVTAKRHIIRGHFPSIKQVADYSKHDVKKILSDNNMIRHEKKIEACVKNALLFKELINRYGSISNYIQSFNPKESFENTLNLKNDLQKKLEFIGPTTIFHFLTDIGMQVIKPDRVLGRIFYRLGLVESENNLLECVLQGREFAKHTKLPIRYVDIIFVAYGQTRSIEFGIDKGICLSNPRCEFCGITDYCQFKQKINEKG
jgi:DNA-3-methyladenine glycosylase I